MGDDNMKLPSQERVRIVGGLYPKLMEIADPIPIWLFERLTTAQVIQVIEVGIKFQNKLIEVEMGRLKAQSEALGEAQKVIHGFK